MKTLFLSLFLINITFPTASAQNLSCIHANSQFISQAVLRMHANQAHFHPDDWLHLIDIAFQDEAQAGYTVRLARNVVLSRMGIINAPSIQAENQLLVDRLYAKMDTVPIASFEPDELLVLKYIAHQCPELGGTAVYRARSIYALIDTEVYDDNCPVSPQAKMTSLDTCHSDVLFVNPSLEGTPMPEQAPNQWTICESTPDMYSEFSGTIPPSDSYTYAGLGAIAFVPLEESFGSQLQDTLIKGKTYKFLFDFARFFPQYPAGISLWIGSSLCSKEQLIYSDVTSDSLWTTRLVQFVPNDYYPYFIVSAQIYSPTADYALIDNLRPVPCDTLAPPTDTTYLDPLLPEKELMRLDEIEVSDFVIYPNPNSTAALQVDWGLALPSGEIVVVDALGRAVASYAVVAGAAQQAIDIAALPSGFYTVLLRLEERIIARAKLIVARE